MANIPNIPLLNNEIDSSSLNGLRGLASVHIMLCHYLFNLLSTISLTLFYLLCGFTLALGYGRTTYLSATTKDEQKVFNSLKFYQNRFARIGPLYYLTNILCLTCKCGIKCVQGSPQFWKTTLLTLTMTNSWTFVGWNATRDYPFVGVTWFITTLSFFYLIFPRLLPALQTLTTNQLSSLIVWLFHLQCLPVLFDIRGTGTALYWVNTANPIKRLPVFIMGVAAGLVRIKGIDQNFNVDRNFLHDIFPWGFSQPDNFGLITCDSASLESTSKWKVDRNGFLLIGLIIAASTNNTMWLDKLIGTDTNTWIQFICAHMELIIIVGLTQDGGKSITSKILKLPPVQLLGEISLTIYILHQDVRRLTMNQLGMDKNTWDSITISIFSTIIVSIIVTKLFTEPLQNMLKAKKEK